MKKEGAVLGAAVDVEYAGELTPGGAGAAAAFGAKPAENEKTAEVERELEEKK